MDNSTPIFIKSFFGKRIIVSESSKKQCFSLPKETADLIKVASGFSKRKKLYVRYQDKDLQVMETLDRKSSGLLNHSSKKSGSYIFKDTNRY